MIDPQLTMTRVDPTNAVGHRTRCSRYAKGVWRLFFGMIGVCLTIILAGCGADRPKGLQLAVIQELPEDIGSWVTIIDFDEEPPSQFELRVGESKHGIELVEVNQQRRTALIRRDGKEILLKMREGEQAGAPNP